MTMRRAKRKPRRQEAGDHKHLDFSQFSIIPAQMTVKDFMEAFVEFPPRQKPASFSIQQAEEQMTKAMTGNR